MSARELQYLYDIGSSSLDIACEVVGREVIRAAEADPKQDPEKYLAIVRDRLQDYIAHVDFVYNNLSDTGVALRVEFPPSAYRNPLLVQVPEKCIYWPS